MSDAFNEREKGFERKYQLDEERQFRVLSRRDKLFGLWVAAKLGHAGAAAEAYAKKIVDANFQKPGDDDMLEVVRADLSAAKVAVGDKDLAKQLSECHHAAVRQIETESK
jgi:hypothetical protein